MVAARWSRPPEETTELVAHAQRSLLSWSAAGPAHFPRDGLPEVAFLGRSNVGKSSLLNALLGSRGLAKVSSTPGRTQTVNFFRVDEALYFADLPGYGYAKVPESVRGTWENG